ANHNRVTVNGLGGNDTFDLNSLPGTGAMTSLTLDGGANNDTINVRASTAATPVTANGGADDDTINVGSFINELTPIQGRVTVNGGAHSVLGDALVINDHSTVFAKANQS